MGPKCNVYIRMYVSLSSDVLKFDNSYSWTRSKEVFYSVKMMPPDTDICSSQKTTPTQTEAAPLNPESSPSEEGLRTTSNDKPEIETGLTMEDQEAPPNF